MKHWDKSIKKDNRRYEERDIDRDNNKKRKLRPVEKTKYRLRSYDAPEKEYE